jgi:putative tryptophan/tyrosine transport system substrate-binding protein
MRRREFILSVGSAAAVWSRAARAQPAQRVRRVALVFPNAPVSDMAGPDPINRYAKAFVHALRDVGYVEGRHLILERRSAEGRYEQLDAIVTELVASKIDVIVIPVGINAQREAAKRAASKVPVVMAGAYSPVEHRIVASLARPGGNITGFTFDAGPEIEGKRLQMLKEAVPAATRIAFLGISSDWEGPNGGSVRAVAQVLNLALVPVELDPARYADAFALITRERPQAIFASRNGAHFVNRQLLADFALNERIPSTHSWRDIAEAGGLMSYGTDYAEILRKSAGYVDKILKGAKPGDLPVEQPTKFELVINLKTAKALGLTIPQSILLRADEVIE